MNQKEKLEHNQKLLDAYELKMGMPNFCNGPGSTTELQGYLDMDRDELEKMSTGKMWAISVRLSQFSFYIQRSINRNNAIIKYADHELNTIVANEINQYDKFTKHDVKVYQIAQTNSAAIEVLKIKSYAEQIVSRMHDLSSGIKSLSYVMSSGMKYKGDNNE